MSASSFLAYGNNLLVVRVIGVLAKNGGVQGDGTAPAAAITVKNKDDYIGITGELVP